ncbi:heme peroxidase [Diplogelasinospora grovesii]|uniref:Heme peroxidase n=1 Tax=Diplogelasinospora grovesii TaxID=303347 RepID=A0AAN6S4J2_9PEZI|nr:heme peroxidase [Diplogelasinospora grovesii]
MATPKNDYGLPATNGTNGAGVASHADGINGASKNASHKSSAEPWERLASQAKPRPTPDKIKPHGANRAGVTNAFEYYGQVIQTAHRPFPVQTGDGSTFITEKKWGKFRDDIKTLRLADYRSLRKLAKAKLKGERIADDKEMLMERVIQLVSNLPSNSKTRVELTNNFLGELWYSLEHPPSLYVGEKFQYRMADGSYNNIMFPQLGAAGTSYARSVRPNVVRPGALPDPSLIFDSVMKRTEYKEHPNNVSSILWYWASIIIHDLFWTDYRDMSKSKTSSYLDLSPLYGSNQAMQDTIRTFKDGKLKTDSFADKRLLGMPPGVGVLLIMFNRFHNYTCDNLIAINEDGRFTAPRPGLDEEKAAAAWKKYDNDLFQTARLITSGLYINITLLDYVRNIVNLNRVDTTWTLDPRQDTGIDVGTKQGAERGTGNVCSAEFNLCYRWHSCISAKDDQWIQDFYYDLFKKPGEELTVQDLVGGFAKFEGMIPEDPIDRPFSKFKRGPDGKFDDDELVECIASAVDDPAGSFGAQNVPGSMRAIEILGIIQGRRWNVAGLNEFRKHFGLKPYETFEDINSDPGVANALRHLYDHPDFVELYPGLVAEEHKKPMVPGVGIAPTYTISRVVLSDAVCLVRGDRHYTIDYNPRNLTNWGYTEVEYDLNVNHGCVFYKLFIRAFPNHFKPNSVYAHYPMVTSSENKQILKDLKRDHLFDFTRPGRIARPTEVTSYGGAKHVLQNHDNYQVTWHQGLTSLIGRLSGDGTHHDSYRKNVHEQLYSGDFVLHIKAYYRHIMEELLVTKSYLLAGHRQADVVRDIGNLAHVHFASRVFNLPLKTKDNAKGIYTEHELYAVLAALYECIFLDVDPVKAFPLQQAAKTLTKQLGTMIESSVKTTAGGGLLCIFSGDSATAGMKKSDPLCIYGVNMVKGLSKAGLSHHDIAYGHVLPTACAMVGSQAEAFAQAVDFYLSPAGVPHILEINKIATQPSNADTDALLLGYAMEGIRLAGSSNACSASREAAVADTITEDDGHVVSVEPGSRVAVSFVSANRDATQFPEPETVNPRRPLDQYIHYNGAGHSSNGLGFGETASQVALVEMFRALFKRRNVRRVPGPQGELKRVIRPDGSVRYMREDWGAMSPFPSTMRVAWDD